MELRTDLLVTGAGPPRMVSFIYIAWDVSAYCLPALWLYDFLLTLPTEVSSIWKSKFSGVTVAYVLNRYCYMLAMLVNLATSYETHPTDNLYYLYISFSPSFS